MVDIEIEKHPESVNVDAELRSDVQVNAQSRRDLGVPATEGVLRRISGVRYASPRYNNRLCGKAYTAGASCGV